MTTRARRLLVTEPCDGATNMATGTNNLRTLGRWAFAPAGRRLHFPLDRFLRGQSPRIGSASRMSAQRPSGAW